MERRTIQEAIERQDAEALERALEGVLPDGADGELLHASAGVLMAGRRWEKAAGVLGRLPAEDVGGRMKRNLCQNLAAMWEHRPVVYEKLIGSGVDDRYSVIPSATGHPTVLYRHGDRKVVLSPNHRPLEGLKQVVESLTKPYLAGEAMVLMGLGDGYYLHHIARNPPKLLLDGQQAIYVIEPDEHAVLACLMMHDYAGERGPIEQKRFQWFVGEDWQPVLKRRLLGDAMLPLPGIKVSLGVNAAEMGQGVLEATRAAVEVNERLTQRIGEIYCGFEGKEVAGKLRRVLREASSLAISPSLTLPRSTGGGEKRSTGGGEERSTGGGEQRSTGGGEQRSTGGGEKRSTGGGEQRSTGGGEKRSTGGGEQWSAGVGERGNDGMGEKGSAGVREEWSIGGEEKRKHGEGGRPRVMLITTRFTTVLQYSTADVADALEGLGFEVRTIIEPSAYHRLSKIAIRQALAEFRPDLVMQLDHQRQEYGDLFPPGLPFVCWGQDHLPNLKNVEAGQKLTSSDFLLTDAVPTYVNAFGYPRRQCIALPKLTREAGGEFSLGESSSGPSVCAQGEGAPVLSFVSNASHDPVRLLDQKLEEMGAVPMLRMLMGECGRKILGMYERGECLSTFVAVRECVLSAQREMGVVMGPEELEWVANWLAHPFNDALYRQQALVWAAEAAEELSLSLGLYGKGWEDHPKLGRYARGPVAYGRELAKLTRKTRLNLQVVPFPCVHQRLLDGVLAGGFFLIREHPVDRVMPAMLDFLHQRGLKAEQHTEQVLAKLSGADRERFLAMAKVATECTRTSRRDDPVEMMRCFEEAQLIQAGEPIVPGYDEVAFGDAGSLRQRIERFWNHPDESARIVKEQAESIRRRFTYAAGMGRVLGRIGQLLSESEMGVQEGLAA